jgi:transposase
MVYPQERDDQARQEWLEAVTQFDVRTLIFLDETSSFVAISRSYAWAPSHERAVDSCPKGKKQRVSLRHHADIAEHAMLHPESVDKQAFKAYLERVLLPRLEPGTTLIMDNWTVHHGHDITELVKSFGYTICYLPTYSPDFNPIEYLFSKIKAVIKACRPSSIAELMDAFSKAILSITPQHIANALSHCGYVVQ